MRLISELVLVGLVATAFVARPGFAPETSPNQQDQSGKGVAAVFTPDDTARLPGIDVSHYQGDIRWQQVKAAGVAFAYAKASEGVSYVDHRYNANAAGAAAVGLPSGAYHFYSPDRDPIAQAEHFLQVAQVGPGSLPPVLDVEKAISHQSSAEMSRGIRAWLDHVHQATGCQPLLYASPSFFERHFDKTLAGTPYWLAEYSRTPRPPAQDSTWMIWQHSQKGSVDGINGAVDLNWFAGDLDALQTFRCR